MARTILVTGATGTLGRAVTQCLLGKEVHVRALSRNPAQSESIEWVTGNLMKGTGIDAAVAGADAIVHCATDPRRPRVDSKGTEKLIEACQRAGKPHLIYISIVGVDRIPLGYYRAKLQAEAKIRQADLPWTILRATQFHQLVLSALDVLARLPVVVVPADTRFQPVDPEDVAPVLAELAAGGEQHQVPDFGGPQVHSSEDLARAYLAATGRRRAVLSARLPGKIAQGYRRGAHLTQSSARGRRTWQEFLAARFGCPSHR